MASIDFEHDARGPRTDHLGVGFFTFHMLVSAYVLLGWLMSSIEGIALYLLLLPGIALQWYFNRGSCMLNNIETWLRTGCWRHPSNREEAAFLQMIAHWLFGIRPSLRFLDGLSYVTVLVLWCAGLAHLTLLMSI